MTIFIIVLKVVASLAILGVISWLVGLGLVLLCAWFMNAKTNEPEEVYTEENLTEPINERTMATDDNDLGEKKLQEEENGIKGYEPN